MGFTQQCSASNLPLVFHARSFPLPSHSRCIYPYRISPLTMSQCIKSTCISYFCYFHIHVCTSRCKCSTEVYERSCSICASVSVWPLVENSYSALENLKVPGIYMCTYAMVWNNSWIGMGPFAKDSTTSLLAVFFRLRNSCRAAK